MKIYTRTGDDGTTGIIGSGRLSKADLRIACVGDVDELNACIGLAAVLATDSILQRLRQIQNELFIIGSHLATPEPSIAATALPQIEDAMIVRLEQEIDHAELHLSPLAAFILPGGCELAARLHLARTVCRRVERAIIMLAKDHPVETSVRVYVNRLSDWLFMHSRLANHHAGYEDIPWEKAQGR